MAEPIWDLPPAVEVRRRGDRLARRRRARWASVGGTAAAAALVVPLALVGPSDQPSVPPGGTVAPSPTPAWPDRVPAGFSLTAGMTDASPSVSIGSDALMRTTTVCGEGRWVRGLPAGATDGRVATGEDEQRILLLYPDAGAASGVLAEARRTASTCGGDAAGTGRRLALSDDVGGEESWLITLTDDAGGSESVVALRVGNAVLLDHASTPGPSTPGARIAPVVRAMCVFAEQPCRG